MAIIRSKIARQLLAEGGVSLDDAKMMAPEGEFLAYINPKEAGILKSMGGSGKMTPMGIPSFTEDEEDQLAMDAPDYSSLDFEEQAAVDRGEPTAQMSTMARDFQGFGPGDSLSDLQAPTFFQNVSTGLSNLVGQGRRGQNIINFLGRSTAPTMRGRLGLGKPGDINYILEQLQSNKGDPVAIGLTNKQFEIGQKLIDAGIKNEADIRGMTQSQFDTLFPGPQTSEGGDSEPIKRLRAPITEAKKEEPKNEFDELLKFYGARFEDGGDVRQEYGLGSIVKKAVGAVKKVAKSPIGKAALFAAPFIKFPGMQSSLFAKAFPNMANDGILKSIFMKDDKLNPFTAITAASLLAGSLAKEEEEDDTLPAAQRSDPAFQSLLAYYGGPRRFAAEGGMMEQDEMLDLGGKEMDLRGGGFVPLGEYEKKDDVPARLSKNEFVMTADAVRAAGGGSVDRGADIMYKTMKTLENKVA
jgi:hypothetical protein